MQEITYKLLQPDDAENYSNIRLECLKNYPEFFGDTFEEELKIGTTRFQKEFISNDGCSFLYGAFLDETLIGISGFLQQKRIKTRHRGDLVQVYTKPTFSGCGIGSRLVELTIANAFDNNIIETILLSVVYTNNKAVGIYKKFGFTQYGFIENYFKCGSKNWPQLFMVLTRDVYMKSKSRK